MSSAEFRQRWRALTADERRFVRVVATLGETTGTDAGNELVAAYAARRLGRFRLAAHVLVAAVWAAYLVMAFTLLRGTSTTLLGAVAVLCAAGQAAWVLRAEGRLERVISLNQV